VFATASDAVTCALALQRRLAGGQGLLPMGVHTGDVDAVPGCGHAGPALSHGACLRGKRGRPARGWASLTPTEPTVTGANAVRRDAWPKR